MSHENFSAFTDDELWKLITLNDRYAFDEIYQRYWKITYQNAFKVLKNHENSSDITQEIFVDLWFKRHSKEIASFASYLYGMVRLKVFRLLRDGKISTKHLERIQKITFVNQTEQMVNFEQLKTIYEQSVTTLPDRCREVFVLSREEYLSVKEIATRLDISPKTVENQITKALKHLRIALQEIALLAIIMCV